MSYAQALRLAYDRQLFGAQAYNLARSPNNVNPTMGAREIFQRLCFKAAMRELSCEP